MAVKVYDPKGRRLSAREMAEWANTVAGLEDGKGLSFVDFINSSHPKEGRRLKGHMCGCGVDCNGMSNGTFTLLPIDSSAVIEGGKPYMMCRVCGEYSHL